MNDFTQFSIHNRYCGYELAGVRTAGLRGRMKKVEKLPSKSGAGLIAASNKARVDDLGGSLGNEIAPAPKTFAYCVQELAAQC